MSDLKPNNMDMIELLHALKGVAESTRKFFLDLRDEGFTEDQAMRLTAEWVRAISTPRSE